MSTNEELNFGELYDEEDDDDILDDEDIAHPNAENWSANYQYSAQHTQEGVANAQYYPNQYQYGSEYYNVNEYYSANAQMVPVGQQHINNAVEKMDHSNINSAAGKPFVLNGSHEQKIKNYAPESNSQLKNWFQNKASHQPSVPNQQYSGKHKYDDDSNESETQYSDKVMGIAKNDGGNCLDSLLKKSNVIRSELKNIRKQMHSMSSQHKKDVRHVENLLEYNKSSASKSEGEAVNKDSENKFNPLFENWKPIGFIESAYHNKNGTPRQGCLVKESRGKIRILDALYNNPQHSLDGLDQYSHVWLIFAFDRNSSDSSNNTHSKPKVSPPRLGGVKVGVFASRSPHRANPIGLTLAKLDGVQGSTVHVSGVDLLYGTAILDIKPYIPDYDAPDISSDVRVSREEVMSHVTATTNIFNSDSVHHKPVSKGITVKKLKQSQHLDHLMEKSATNDHNNIPSSVQMKNRELLEDVHTAQWLTEAKERQLTVVVNPAVDKVLHKFHKDAQDPQYRLATVPDSSSLRKLLITSVQSDPRSNYRRLKCPDLLHHFTVDRVTVTAAFLEDDTVEILRIKPSQSSQDAMEMDECS